jgi:hypothetical protein
VHWLPEVLASVEIRPGQARDLRPGSRPFALRGDIQLDVADFGERMLRVLCAVAQPPVRRGMFEQVVARFGRERRPAGEAGQNEHEAGDDWRAGIMEQVHTLFHGSPWAALQLGDEDCEGVLHGESSFTVCLCRRMQSGSTRRRFAAIRA